MNDSLYFYFKLKLSILDLILYNILTYNMNFGRKKKDMITFLSPYYRRICNRIGQSIQDEQITFYRSGKICHFFKI